MIFTARYGLIYLAVTVTRIINVNKLQPGNVSYKNYEPEQ